MLSIINKIPLVDVFFVILVSPDIRLDVFGCTVQLCLCFLLKKRGTNLYRIQQNNNSIKSQSARKLKCPKFQKIDFLLTKHGEPCWVHSQSRLYALHMLVFVMSLYFMVYCNPSMSWLLRKSIFSDFDFPTDWLLNMAICVGKRPSEHITYLSFV